MQKKTYKLTNQKKQYNNTHQHTKTHAEENMNKTTNVQQLNIQYMQQTTNLKLKTSILHACRKFHILTIQKAKIKTFSNIQSNDSNNPNWPSQKRKLTNTRTKSKTEVVSPGKMFHPKAIIQRIENTNQIFKISASEQKQETPRSTNLTSNFKISNLANLQSFS